MFAFALGAAVFLGAPTFLGAAALVVAALVVFFGAPTFFFVAAVLVVAGFSFCDQSKYPESTARRRLKAITLVTAAFFSAAGFVDGSFLASFVVPDGPT